MNFGRGRNLKMQMRQVEVARTPYPPQGLAAPHTISGLDQNAARLKVKVPCIAAVPEIEHDLIARNRVHRIGHRGAESLHRSGNIVGPPVPRDQNRCVSDRIYRLSISVIRAQVMDVP